MIAARLSGLKEFSYAALMEKYFQLPIAKASQKANWARRPLSPQMMEYAVNDTRHLAGLADILSAELDRQNRRVWFDQLCDRAIRSAEVDKEIDPDQLWRVPGSGHLRGRAAAIFRELWKWRDEEARPSTSPHSTSATATSSCKRQSLLTPAKLLKSATCAAHAKQSILQRPNAESNCRNPSGRNLSGHRASARPQHS
jgi:ribonuclease D